MENSVKPKKLSRAYHEIKRKKTDSHKYIINFDTLASGDKRLILQNYILGTKYDLSDKSNDEIDEMFGKNIRNIIRDLEQDISNVY